MGPSDPFAGTTPPSAPPADAPERPGGPSAAGGAGPYRVQARSSPVAAPPRAGGPAVGAVVGLVFGLVTIVAGFGPALVVLAFALVGAAVGALARAAGEGGLDLPGAWRALRRRP